MARSRNINAYPRLYWEIVERVAVKKEEFAREVDSMRTAVSMRGSFYAFRGALKRALDEARRSPTGLTTAAGLTQAQLDDLENAFNWSQSVVFWIKPLERPEDPIVVKFLHRDLTPKNLLLARMLESGSQPTDGDTAAADESAARLLEKLGNPPEKKYY